MLSLTQSQMQAQAHVHSQCTLKAHMLSLSLFHNVGQNMLWKPKQKGACECGHHQGQINPRHVKAFLFSFSALLQIQL